MPIRVDEEQLEANDRPAAIALALYTLRAMEEWRRTVPDYDCVMILLAVAAILGERLARVGVAPEYASLGRPIEPSLLPRCNVSSIAHATGLNRESTRRKVNDLIRRELLERAADGTIGFRAGLLQQAWARKMVKRQLVEAAALANRLTRLGVFVEG